MITKNNLIQAIQNFNAGNVPFNNRDNLYCFLFENTWYPLRAVINHASALAGENLKYTKNDALVKLVEICDYVKVKQVVIQNNTLVHLNTQEKLEEINDLANIIKKLSE